MYKKQFYFNLSIFIGLIVFASIFSFVSNPTYLAESADDTTPKANGAHDPISIDGNDALIAFCAGNGSDGSESNPYIIQNYEIDATSGSGIDLSNIDLYLNIQGCTISGEGSQSPGINLGNCGNITITNNSIYETGYGIYVMDSSSLNISNNICYKSGVNGIDLYNVNSSAIGNNNCSLNGNNGINISGGNNFKITDNNCTSNDEDGIDLDNVNSGIISNNNCTSNDEYGIDVNSAHNITMAFNKCSLNDEGFCLRNSYNNSILSNAMQDNYYDGIWLDDSNSTTILNNIMQNCGIYIGGDTRGNIIDTTNKVDGESIHYYENQTQVVLSDYQDVAQVFLVNCNNSIIEKLDVSRTSSMGICLIRSNDNTISQNDCSFNYDGISLYNSPNNIISQNNCSFDDYGIYLEDTFNSTISQNYCSFNEDTGIYLSDSQNSTIAENNCSFNDSDGTYLSGSSNSSITQNDFTFNNEGGIYVSGSSNSTITQNSFTFNSEIGIYLTSSSNNTISNNTILSNDDYGIYLNTDAKDNIIWLNSLIDNYGNQSYAEELNAWNFTGIGNYYGNYTIRYPEATEDGSIWSIPYQIDGNVANFDYFPLLAFPDYENPSWSQSPVDQMAEFGVSFSYDINATDNIGINLYWLNDTTHFQINSMGVITNISLLMIGEYWLEIFVNDTSDNILSTIIKIEVVDTQDPVWSHALVDQTIDFGTIFTYNVNATDNIAINQYCLNDTTLFQIDATGIITNTTSLEVGIYHLTVYVDDASGNEITAIISITVEALDDPTTSTTTSTTETTTTTDSSSTSSTDDPTPGDENGVPGFKVGVLGIFSLATILFVKKQRVQTQ